jgi:outer membrane lipopolysaccharide assembly protein LptE/RlpB
MYPIPLRFWLNGLSHWMREQVVTDVPADLAPCEFDCRQTTCSSEEWTTCQCRISRAAGELMPLVRQDRQDIGLDVESDQEPVGAT